MASRAGEGSSFPEPDYDGESPHSSAHSYDYEHSQDHQSSDGAAQVGGDDLQHSGGRPPTRRRACEACRKLKVQCNFESSKSEACRRCMKAGRRCVVMERRRRQVIANSVSELERKLEVLTATLRAIKAGPDAQDEGTDPQRKDNTSKDRALDFGSKPKNDAATNKVLPGQSRFDSNARTAASSGSTSGPNMPPAPAPPPAGDVIDRQIISRDEAVAVFDYFVANMVPLMPAVVFPFGTTADQIRKASPNLFLAILGAGSGILSSEQQTSLNDELIKLLSNKILLIGEKSLELIQAIVVAMLWYRAPKKFEELKHYQYIHSASIMAIDIGLNKRQRKTSVAAPDGTSGGNAKAVGKIPLDPSTVESRRAWLGCYLLCSQTAQNFRRENLIRWNAYMDDCLQFLETSPEASLSDEILCHWIRLQHLTDDISVHFSVEDPSSRESYEANKMQFAIQGFESQLRTYISYRCRTEKPVVLEIAELLTKLYLHEVALHAGHHNDDVQPPYTEQDFMKLRPTQAKNLSSAHISSLTTCLATIHTIFDKFSTLPIDTIRAFPTIVNVRLVYAAIILVKMAFDTTFPDSEIGRMFKLSDFKIDSYLLLIAARLKAAGEGGHCISAAKFAMVFLMLKAVFDKLVARNAEAAEEANTWPAWATAGTKAQTAPQVHPFQQPNVSVDTDSNIHPNMSHISNIPQQRRQQQQQQQQLQQLTVHKNVAMASSQMIPVPGAVPLDRTAQWPDASIPDTMMSNGGFGFDNWSYGVETGAFPNYFSEDQALLNSMLSAVPAEYSNQWSSAYRDLPGP